jgi:hypothetical protein
MHHPGRPVPTKTIYHRVLGWHAPELRRALVVLAIGLAVAGVLDSFVHLPLAAVGGWDAAACTFVVVVWHLAAPATAADTERLATRTDQTIGSATALLLTLSTARCTAWAAHDPKQAIRGRGPSTRLDDREAADPAVPSDRADERAPRASTE